MGYGMKDRNGKTVYYGDRLKCGDIEITLRFRRGMPHDLRIPTSSGKSRFHFDDGSFLWLQSVRDWEIVEPITTPPKRSTLCRWVYDGRSK